MTQGPFFPANTNVERDADLTRLVGRSQRATGQVMELRGKVFDAKGQPVSGARIELWQANAAGRYDHPRDDANPAAIDPNFQGYALLVSGPDGGFRVTTIKPTSYNVPEIGVRTPHLHWKVEASARRLSTQSYFPDEPLTDSDALMRRMGAPSRALSHAQASSPSVRGVVTDVSNPMSGTAMRFNMGDLSGNYEACSARLYHFVNSTRTSQ